MHKFEALPSWLLVNMIWPFLPKDHGWKKRGKMFTLVDWYQGRTATSRDFDLVMWLQIPMTTAIVLVIMKGL